MTANPSFASAPLSSRLVNEEREMSVKIGVEYQAERGFRHAKLAETALHLISQQTSSHRIFQSACLWFLAAPEPGIVTVRTTQRSVGDNSNLVTVDFRQGDVEIMNGFAVVHRDWLQRSDAEPAPPLDEPQRFRRLPNDGAETSHIDCRDASAALTEQLGYPTLGGFARLSTRPVVEAPHLPAMIEPWLAMPGPSKSTRVIRELALELHTPLPGYSIDPSQLARVALRVQSTEADQESIHGGIWAYGGDPLASVRVRSSLQK